MTIRSIKLKNFRCFRSSSFDFDSKIVFIEGRNGTGKTSLLEALYYACFLRSFRTASSSNLINFNADHFFVSVEFEEKALEGCSQIQAGFSKDAKLVKLNRKSVNSYKEVIDHYKILSATEEDLQLVKGAPEVRRSFLNQALFLENADFVSIIRKYRQTVNNRSGLLFGSSEKLKRKDGQAEFAVWSRQLWNCTVEIQELRKNYLRLLEEEVNNLLIQHFDSDFFIKMDYLAKNDPAKDFETFWEVYKEKRLSDELRLKRNLFGAHLDDFVIDFKGKKAKFYASRGQQKLVVFLIKIAQLQQLLKSRNKTACFLLDDFLTDFDLNFLKRCLQLLNQLEVQTFLTFKLNCLRTKILQ